MKTTLITAAVGLAVGLVSGVWVFTNHSWNPAWLAWLNLPGIFLGTCMLPLTDGTVSAAGVCGTAGISIQWLFLGAAAGFAIHKIYGHKQRT